MEPEVVGFVSVFARGGKGEGGGGRGGRVGGEEVGFLQEAVQGEVVGLVGGFEGRGCCGGLGLGLLGGGGGGGGGFGCLVERVRRELFVCVEWDVVEKERGILP